MSEFITEHWKYALGAIGLHGILIALLLLIATVTFTKPPPVQLAIQATIVDKNATAARAQDKEREAREKKQAQEQAEAKEREENERKLKQQQDEANQRIEAQKKLDEQRQAEAQRQQEILDKQRQAEAQKKLDDAKRKQQQADAEKQRVAEIQRKQQDEADKKRAAEDAKTRARRESDLKSALAEEESVSQAQSSGALAQYIALLKQLVERQWIKPLSAKPGVECTVKLTQTQSGTVLTVTIGECNGDEAVRQSIQTAVLRASPLPPPADMRVFDRNLTFVFKPDDNGR